MIMLRYSENTLDPVATPIIWVVEPGVTFVGI